MSEGNRERARLAGVHFALIRASMNPPTLPGFPEFQQALEGEYAEAVDQHDQWQLKAFQDGFVEQWNATFDDALNINYSGGTTE